MTTRKRIIIFLLFVLTIELVATTPHLTFSTLFVSEEEGIVKNIEYNEHFRSSEELQAKDESEVSNEINMILLPTTGTTENNYKIFERILIRDSRQVIRNKLREVKARQDNEETSVSHFFVMLKRINKIRLTNESQEGQLMYDAIKQIIVNTEDFDYNANHTIWFDNILKRIIHLAQNVHTDDEIKNLIDNFTIEQEIKEHFDIFTRFWLNYPHTRYRRTINDLTIPNDREIYETLCVIDISHLALNTTDITYSAFAKILIRDSKKVTEDKLKESTLQQLVEDKEYLKVLKIMLKNIGEHELVNAAKEGKSMYQVIKKINNQIDVSKTAWLDNIVDRIFCHAQKARSAGEVQDLIENFTMVDAIKEHFHVFKQFWLNCANLYIQTDTSRYGICVLNEWN